MEQQEEHGDLTALLPEHVLAEVLRRVTTPRWLAVARSVCKAWHAIVDGESLLRTELPFCGMFIDYNVLPLPEFFSRPPSPCRPTISGNLDFLPLADEVCSDDEGFNIHDHCNGLILVSVYLDSGHPVEHYSAVVNPATQRWDILPSSSSSQNHGTDIGYHKYLAFDPMVSSNYMVFGIPYLFQISKLREELDPILEETTEWPPSPYILPVFSQRTRRWEERSFVRQGDAAGTIANSRLYSYDDRLCSVYWRGSLYVHCQTNFVMRIFLSQDKYTVIRPPTSLGYSPYLGMSEKGVYFASFVEQQIRVFVLNESCDRMEWIFKNDYDLNPVKEIGQLVDGPWILEDINYDMFHCNVPEIEEKELVQESSGWNSDNDDFDDSKDVAEAFCFRYSDVDILGFHPYKEILFLCSSTNCKSNALGFAYHLNSFKVESLGSMYPAVYQDFDSGLPNAHRDIDAFPYTPCCWIEEIPETVN